ncbi:hypothetical protein DWF00_13305 [Bosea caraganae]|uniref:Uncharacterized protein n=1 Tax=Bosea caraganae TaxID=2763117 RepID=A0A370L161_9HYPH|nr:hypothetical protein [Bosea caraganae]RDJ21292.1 hypothetical protein DWE98_21470 [Bosea caraganae]RDJ26432.1 hypothetical protein DWF00_13305 [Bosea caraganae]
MVTAALLSLSLSTGLVIPVAETVPRFDIEATCKTAEAAGGGSRTVSACRDDERKAQLSLEAKWASYRPGTRNECVEATQVGGIPSYVQVLTCLELAATTTK